MPIIELQRRLQEAGRIRIGKQVETKTGKKRPAALETFRLTSPDRSRIDAAAKLYGGQVVDWENNGRKEYEVVTEADRLPVIVPPGAMAFSQWYELWSAGGCQRRCDGHTEQIKDQPCVCDAAAPECDPHTRLSLLLTDVPGLGLWRLDTQGWYAARELASAVETISVAAGKGLMLPATLRLEQRSTKKLDEGVHRFVTPVLDIEATPGQLIRGELQSKEARAALTPVPQSTDAPASIAEQIQDAKAIESRKRTASMKSTGVRPRTAQQAQSAKTTPADEPPPDDTSPVDAQVLVSTEQLVELKDLLAAHSLTDRDQCLNWIMIKVGHELASPSGLTVDEFEACKQQLLKPPPPTAADAAGLIQQGREKIVTFYEGAPEQDMLNDLTQFLQRPRPLNSLEDLTIEDIVTIIDIFNNSKEQQ